MATVVSLGGKRKSPSLEPLLALCTDDMGRVDREIVARMRSPVALIPELANHLVGAGGKRMVEEGVLSMEPKPQAAFGFHQWPFLPLGSIGGRPGPMLAATELFDIVVSGVGGHAAMFCSVSIS